MPPYEILYSSSKSELECLVNDRICDGYIPYGNFVAIFVNNEGVCKFYQPMIKKLFLTSNESK